MEEFNVPAAPGLAAAKLDLNLHRGVLIEGRATDKSTGEPIAGARMTYAPWPDNPNIKGLTQFNGFNLTGPQSRFPTNRDGRFTIVGLPGRGLVELNCPSHPYPNGQGMADIKDLPNPDTFY